MSADVEFVTDLDVPKQQHMVLCLPGKQFSQNYVGSLTRLLQWLVKHKWRVTLRMAYKANVFACRNFLFGVPQRPADNVPFEGKIPTYTHMLWIDSDMVFSPIHVQTLLSRNKPIICGCAKMQSGLYAIVENRDLDYWREHQQYEYLTDKKLDKRSEPFTVAFTGMAFMLIQKGVIERFAFPWITQHFETLGDIIYPLGEDVSFCERAQKLGFDIWVDPMVRIGHEKLKVIV